jgi:transposase InsO family protein
MSKKKRKQGQSVGLRGGPAGSPGDPQAPGRYSLEVRRRAVRLHVEEGIPFRVIAEEVGVSHDSIREWVKRYRQLGEAGLRPRPGGSPKGRAQLPPAVHAAIVKVKEENPTFGVRRIAHWLHRTLFLPGSPETVRQTLKRHAVPASKPRRKPKRNPPKPRFFERSTPNQMWQADIFTFQVTGHNAYLIGFIDDHSRYIVGLGVFRGQTAENVLEVYRRAVGAYGAPKEMLTDNGRQYVAWHGKTRFQEALARDRVHHIRSAPHHPMTLGKIERFWKTIWEEFLERARFGTFEEAVDRIAWWVQYYNHKRPHQGIEELCPAERYFKIQQGVREAIEKGIASNVEELALRGKPREPFYMVGRVGGQNVVLQTEGGQLKITVNDQETKGANDERSHGQDTQGTHGEKRPGEVPGSPGAVDGTAAAVGDLPRPGDPGEPAVGLAGTGDGGYASGSGAANAPAGGPGPDAAAADGATPGPQAGPSGDPDRPTGPGQVAASGGEAGGVVAPAGKDGDDALATTVAADDPAGAGRGADRDGGGPATGGLPQDLLRMGGTGAVRDVGSAHAEPAGAAGTGSGSGAGGGGDGAPAPEMHGPGTTPAHPGRDGGC